MLGGAAFVRVIETGHSATVPYRTTLFDLLYHTVPFYLSFCTVPYNSIGLLYPTGHGRNVAGSPIVPLTALSPTCLLHPCQTDPGLRLPAANMVLHMSSDMLLVSCVMIHGIADGMSPVTSRLTVFATSPRM